MLSEYHFATGDKTVLPDLQKVHDLMAKSQYLHMSQINPQAKKSHPDSFPKGPKDSHGGWGHMAYAALAASVDADSSRKLMDANRWWFTMAHLVSQTRSRRRPRSLKRAVAKP